MASGSAKVPTQPPDSGGGQPGDGGQLGNGGGDDGFQKVGGRKERRTQRVIDHKKAKAKNQEIGRAHV